MPIFMNVLSVGLVVLSFLAVYSLLTSLDSIAKSLKKISEQIGEQKSEK